MQQVCSPNASIPPGESGRRLTYSNAGEDLIVATIFSLLGAKHATYLDVGARDPWSGSNTALLYSGGSRGIAVVPTPLALLWQQNRPGDSVCTLTTGWFEGLGDDRRNLGLGRWLLAIEAQADQHKLIEEINFRSDRPTAICLGQSGGFRSAASETQEALLASLGYKTVFRTAASIVAVDVSVAAALNV